MIQHKLFKSRVFCRYIISYAVTFFLPIVILCAILYQTNIRVLREQAYSAQINNVLQFRREMDYEAQRFRSIAAQLSNDAGVRSLLGKARNEMGFNDSMNLRTLVSDLFNYNYDLSTSSILSISLYFRESGYYVDATRATNLADVETGQFAQYGGEKTYQTLAESFQSRSEWYTNDQIGTLWYLQTLPSPLSADQAVLMIALKPEFLSEYIAPINPESINCFLDAQGNALLHSGEVSLPIDVSRMTGSYGADIQREHIAYYARSGVSSYLYVSMLPVSALEHSLNGVRSMIWIIMAVSLAVCAPLTYMVTVRNYRPLDRLNALAVWHCEDSEAADEYENIYRALLEAADNRAQCLDWQAQDRQRKQDLHLRQALAGPAGLSAYTEHVGISPAVAEKAFYCIVTVDYVDYTQSSGEEGIPCGLFVNCREAFVRLIKPMFTVVPMGTEKELLLISFTDERLRPSVRVLVERTLQFIRENYAVDCEVGISRFHQGTESFGQMFGRMMEEAEYSIANHKSKNGSLTLDEQPVTDSADQIYDRMMRACTRGDTEEAERLRTLLATEVSKTLREAKALAAASEAEESPEVTLKQQIIALVQANYADCNLNVSSIADALGKNSDYISRIFKQTTLIGLLDYIHHMRISTAKKLMFNEPEMSLMQISQCVGYASIDSFIRAFKRIEGTTPGRYRDIHGRE